MLPEWIKLELAADSARPSAQWVYALSLGKTWVHDDESGNPVLLDVTLERAAHLVDQTRLVIQSFEASAAETQSEPVRLPVLALHKDIHGEFGHILDVRLQVSGPKKGIWLLTTWNSRYEAGKFSHISVGIAGEFPVQSGERFGPVITELSLCTTPKDQRIGSLNEALSAQLAHRFNLATESTMTPEELEALLAPLLQAAMQPLIEQQTEIMARLDALETDGEPDDDDDDPAPEGDEPAPEPEAATMAQVLAELKNMKAQNVQLAKKLQRREQGGGGPTDPAPELPDDPAKRSAALKQQGVKGAKNIALACFTD